MDRTLIDEAARLLRDAAEDMRRELTIDGEWRDESCAKAIYDNIVRVAAGSQRQADELTRQRDSLLEFAQEVRRTGDTRLASMAIAAIAAAKGSAA